jgi:hypothetical protein
MALASIITAFAFFIALVVACKTASHSVCADCAVSE